MSSSVYDPTTQPIRGEGVNYTAVGMATLRRWPRGLKQSLREEACWDDVIQTVALSAWQAKLGNLTARATSRLCRRNLDTLLADLGWRKVNGQHVR